MSRVCQHATLRIPTQIVAGTRAAEQPPRVCLQALLRSSKRQTARRASVPKPKPAPNRTPDPDATPAVSGGSGTPATLGPGSRRSSRRGSLARRASRHVSPEPKPRSFGAAGDEAAHDPPPREVSRVSRPQGSGGE